MFGLWRRSALVGLVAVTATACAVDSTQPLGLDAPVGASKLTGGSSGSVDLYEDRLQHARFYPDEGEYGVIRQCQANPIEDADGNDWTMQKNGGTTFSKMVEPEGVMLVREVVLQASDFDTAGNLILPEYESDRWVVTAAGTGHITISLWRDASGKPVALNSNVQGKLAPIGPGDSWIDILDEPGDEVGGAHDLRNETFTRGSRAHLQFQAAVAEARADRTLLQVSCDTHVHYANGVPSWIQRNAVTVR